MKQKLIALLFALGVLGAQQVRANQLGNGSFEEGNYTGAAGGYQNLVPPSDAMSGWIVVDGDVDWVDGSYWTPDDGIRSVDLNGWVPGAIAQTFATVPGQTYTVSFDLLSNSYCGDGTKTLRVSAAGSPQDFTHEQGLVWVPETFAFTATAASTMLEFRSLTNIGGGDTRCGPVIDKVSVEPNVPPLPPPPVNQAPDASAAAPSTASIWPPNHKMVPITINGVTDVDGDAVTITITEITNNETGSSDADGIGTSTAQVRATRFGKGSGRTYTISFTADDGKGGIASGSVTVVVPHDQGKRAKPTAIESATWGEVKSSQQ